MYLNAVLNFCQLALIELELYTSETVDNCSIGMGDTES